MSAPNDPTDVAVSTGSSASSSSRMSSASRLAVRPPTSDGSLRTSGTAAPSTRDAARPSEAKLPAVPGAESVPAVCAAAPAVDAPAAAALVDPAASAGDDAVPAPLPSAPALASVSGSASDGAPVATPPGREDDSASSTSSDDTPPTLATTAEAFTFEESAASTDIHGADAASAANTAPENEASHTPLVPAASAPSAWLTPLPSRSGDSRRPHDEHPELHKVDSDPPPPGGDAYSAQTKVGEVSSETWKALMPPVRSEEDPLRPRVPSDLAPFLRPEGEPAPEAGAVTPVAFPAAMPLEALPESMPRLYDQDDEDDENQATLMHPSAKLYSVPRPTPPPPRVSFYPPVVEPRVPEIVGPKPNDTAWPFAPSMVARPERADHRRAIVVAVAAVLAIVIALIVWLWR